MRRRLGPALPRLRAHDVRVAQGGACDGRAGGGAAGHARRRPFHRRQRPRGGGARAGRAGHAGHAGRVGGSNASRYHPQLRARRCAACAMPPTPPGPARRIHAVRRGPGTAQRAAPPARRLRAPRKGHPARARRADATGHAARPAARRHRARRTAARRGHRGARRLPLPGPPRCGPSRSASHPWRPWRAAGASWPRAWAGRRRSCATARRDCLCRPATRRRSRGRCASCATTPPSPRAWATRGDRAAPRRTARPSWSRGSRRCTPRPAGSE